MALEGEVLAKRGRPLKFKSPGIMLTKAQKYFDSTPPELYTITGVALALDTSRETLMDYQEKDEYSDAVKKIKLVVENSYELALRKNGRAGDIFGLKNFGWKDQSELKQDVNMISPIVGGLAKLDVSAYDDDQEAS